MNRTSAGKWQRAFVLGIALVGAAAVGATKDRLAFAQQPGIKRTILLRTDEPGSQTHEAVMGVAEIAPGAMAGKHRHPGIEIGYILEGSVTLEHEGEPAKQLKAGDAFKNEPGVHNARNTGTVPVKILAISLDENGKPIAEPVP
jgi:quercetin dioxygenase-like cupin family protein